MPTPKLINSGGYLLLHEDFVQDLHLKAYLTKLDGAGHTALNCQPGDDDQELEYINWPNPNLEHLRKALIKDQETGILGPTETVILPDGNPFKLKD